jgi:hypothetical protein
MTPKTLFPSSENHTRFSVDHLPNLVHVHHGILVGFGS